MYEYNKQGTYNYQLGYDYNLRLQRDRLGLTMPLNEFDKARKHINILKKPFNKAIIMQLKQEAKQATSTKDYEKLLLKIREYI